MLRNFLQKSKPKLAKKKIGGHSKFTSRFAPPNRSNTKRILVFGDSNAFRPWRSKTTWPKLLEAKDPFHLNVFNESCDGRTTMFDTGEKNGSRIILKKLNLHLPLDFIIVMLGTNDLKNKYGASSVAEKIYGMRQILDTIEGYSGSAKTILLTPPPIGKITIGELAGAHSRLQAFLSEYYFLAMNRDLLFIDLQTILDINTDFQSDMIHLNFGGRQKVADAVWSEIFIQSTPQTLKI